MDEKDAATAPPSEPTPPTADEPAPEPVVESVDEPLVQHPGTIPDPVPVPAPKKRFAKFDKLWESVKRWGSDDDSGGVIPAGPVVRTRHREGRVFFVDTGNVSSSQFAEAFALQEGLHAESGGTFPAGDIPQESFEAMDEKGIDLRGCRPKLIDPSRLGSFDRVVILGGSLPTAWREGVRVEEWEVLNPSGLPLEGYRLVRDDVEKRVKRLAKIIKGKQAAMDAKAKAMLKAR